MPVGASIRITVSVTHCLRRQLSFGFEVVDAANALLAVASGTHQRVYLRGDAFDAALRRKAGETGIRVGLTGTSAHFVDVAHTAGRDRGRDCRGSEEALSTSSLMTWAEEAAIAALEEHLPPGCTTVGGETALAHVAPTPKGMQVTCRAVLSRVTTTRRGALRLLFELSGEDRVGSVMTGTHLRFLVERADFETRAKGVAMPDGRRRGSFAGPLPIAELTIAPQPMQRSASQPPVSSAAQRGVESGVEGSPMRPPRPPVAPAATPTQGMAPAAAAQAAARAAAATAAPQQQPMRPMPSPPPASAMAMGATLPRVTPLTGPDFLF
jgi:fluoroacetyl-CoA thioesterase